MPRIQLYTNEASWNGGARKASTRRHATRYYPRFRRYRTNDEKIIPSSPPIPPTSKFPDFQFQISFCYRGGVRPFIFFPALYTLHRLERVSTSVEIKLGEKCLRVYASGKDLAWRDSNGHRHISPSLHFFFFASHNRSSSRKFLVNSASVFLFLVSPLCFIPLYSSAPSKISFSFPLFKQTAKLSRVPPPGENKYRSSFPSSKRRGISSLRFYFPPHPCVTSPFTDLPQKSCSPPTESSRLSAGRCSIWEKSARMPFFFFFLRAKISIPFI